MKIRNQLIAVAVLVLFATNAVPAAQETVSDEPDAATNQQTNESPSDAEVTDMVGKPIKGDACGADIACGKAEKCFDPYGMDPWSLFPETAGGVRFGGWLQMGYHSEGANGTGVGFPWNFPSGFGKVNPFNNYPNVVQLQQAWVFAEKTIENDGYGWDWGFRADYVYGTDGQDTQAFGSKPGNWDTSWDNGGFYGQAVPQLYAEVAYNDLKVKVGKFFKTVGYEKVQAPENFFYSHSYSFILSPYTHTGFLAEYPVAGCATLYGGWAAGWDSGFDDNGGDIFLGGVSVALTDSISFTYMATMGDFGFVVPGPGSDSDAYMHSMLLDWQITDRLNYVIQSNYLENPVIAPFGPSLTVNQYVFYSLNSRWAVGGRFEWYGGSTSNNELSNFTVGANYRPHANVVIRPEIRVDVLNEIGLQDSTVFGIDAILTF